MEWDFNRKNKSNNWCKIIFIFTFLKTWINNFDEEHDQSYKQDEGVIYNARDMAISKASFLNIPINLVTAVPSLETFYNIKKENKSPG